MIEGMSIFGVRNLQLKKTWPIAFLLLILYSGLEVFLLYFLLVTQLENNLNRIIDRVNEDLILREGVWDLSAYNSDNKISDTNSIYIITSEGFVIERTRPVSGLLDLSRYVTIAEYSTPQQITTVANEKWQVFSQPILSGDRPVGIIMVARYNPKEVEIEYINTQLRDAASFIGSNISTQGELIDISRFDVRKVPFDVGFQIVNRFNKVLLHSYNNNSVSRLPSYIDRSYIENQLKGNRIKQIEDAVSKEKFLTLTSPILDEKKQIAGIVVVGESMQEIYSSATTYGGLILVINLILLFLVAPASQAYFRRINKRSGMKIKVKPKAINFMKKTCKLVVDEEAVDIPYASFQYYFCDALFSKPKKRWEVDELLEIFGEDFGAEKWRKVYDTMVALDRKTSGFVDKLFMVKNKRYFVNPEYINITNHINS